MLTFADVALGDLTAALKARGIANCNIDASLLKMQKE